jgi:hypothetical protein
MELFDAFGEALASPGTPENKTSAVVVPQTATDLRPEAANRLTVLEPGRGKGCGISEHPHT